MATLKLTQDVLDKFYFYREFLKRSDKYTAINKLLIDRSKTYPITDPLVSSWCYAKEELKNPYYDWLHCATSKEERNQLYKQDKSNKTLLNIVYPLFQDIHDKSKYEMLDHRIKLFYELYNFSPVHNAAFKLTDIIDSALEGHSDEKPLSVNNIREELYGIISYMSCIDEMDDIIQFDKLLPDQYLIEQFKRHLKSIKNRDNDVVQGVRTMFISSKGHRNSLLDDLLKLLTRLDAKGALRDKKAQKIALKEIYYEDNPNQHSLSDDDSNWRLLRRHKNLALELIIKAETALFPGPCTAPKAEKGVIITNEFKKIAPLLKVKHAKPFSDNNFDPPIIADCWPFWT